LRLSLGAVLLIAGDFDVAAAKKIHKLLDETEITMQANILSILICLAALAGGCVSPNVLPASAAAADFENSVEGKTGWSKYQELARFEGIGADRIFDAAKAGLGQARFSLLTASRELGVVKGEHGMTMHDWNVVAAVYFRERESGCDVKVIVEGSKDYGFSGDATGDAWTSRILGNMRAMLARDEPPATQKEPKTPMKASGTGFFVSSDGWILTAFHLVEGAERIEVIRPNGDHYQARVVRSQPALDLALLEVDAK
jgi:S1-C subfamily serine protease